MKPPVGVQCFALYRGSWRRGYVSDSHFSFTDFSQGSAVPIDSIEKFDYRLGKGMHPPENERFRVLCNGRWRTGASDGVTFHFDDDKASIDPSISLTEIDAFEPIDPLAYRPSWHHGD